MTCFDPSGTKNERPLPRGPVCTKRTRLCVVYEKNINSYLQLILRARVAPLKVKQSTRRKSVPYVRYVPCARLADRNLRRSGEVKNTYFLLVQKFFLRAVPIIYEKS